MNSYAFNNHTVYKRIKKETMPSNNKCILSFRVSSYHYYFSVLLVLCFKLRSYIVSSNDFEPYALNGGLVSAIAGKDYYIIASDTRLTDGGYEILTRTHLSSRLWQVGDASIQYPQHDVININNRMDDGTSSIQSYLASDGSLKIPTQQQQLVHEVNGNGSSYYTLRKPPTFIASAGCAADCDALKRIMRSEIASHLNWNYGSSSSSSSSSVRPETIANVLGQTLYSRRGFPFYSFCILAGLSVPIGNSSTGCDDNSGVVHVYDAIGSHERVAIACAGTAKEILQPILDRLFSSITKTQQPHYNNNINNQLLENTVITENEKTVLQRDGKAVEASKQRVGLKLLPPVQTTVNCDAEEAVTLLVKGYRSVAEREISVGDNVVICLVQRQIQANNDVFYKLKIENFPLKKH